MTNSPSVAIQHQDNQAPYASTFASGAPPHNETAQRVDPSRTENKVAPSDQPNITRNNFDRLVRSSIMHATLGRSPLSALNAFTDWLGHLAVAPGMQLELLDLSVQRSLQLWQYAASCALSGRTSPSCVVPLPQDKRFSDPAWSAWPFNIIHQTFLMQQEWWDHATTVPGVSPHNIREVSFLIRQLFDQFAPSNFVATNPVVLRETLEQGGENLWNGARNLGDDLQRFASHRPAAGAEAFKVGETVACTPGSVIFRNELIELIQYSPLTDQVHPEPILIVPAWIMKFYILDLSAQNSLVRHLVQAGHTVFMISWRNPAPEHRDLGMDDYLSLGIDAALATVNAVIPNRPVHAVGYCLGGTLLAIAAAALGRRELQPLKTVTLLAAQTDFADAGELTLFIDESEVTFLEDLMWKRGLLEARQMAGAFHLLRSNDLIWSRLVRDYLLGNRTPMSDLMAWNTDATHMPYRMHSEYLRRLFLNNDLASGRYVVGGMPIGLSNIDVPIFVVATTWDHVAPWKSVYKIHLQADVDITFVLTTGGHNAGIVNPPEGSKREYRIGTHLHKTAYVSPERWLKSHDLIRGSWWPAWMEWLRGNSSAAGARPTLGAPTVGIYPIEAAPGSYVFDR
jgi:polyhydroxyalkanoate synthase